MIKILSTTFFKEVFSEDNCGIKFLSSRKNSNSASMQKKEFQRPRYISDNFLAVVQRLGREKTPNWCFAKTSKFSDITKMWRLNIANCIYEILKSLSSVLDGLVLFQF